jgi:hypothetical protein
MRVRLLLLVAAIAALLVLAAAALAASQISVNAPATSTEGESMTVRIAGTAEESGLAVMGVVRKDACAETREEALNQQGPRSNEQSVATGPFALDMNLITVDNTGQALTGFVNVCTYLYQTTGDGTTLATSSASVQLKPKGSSGGFGVQIPARGRMASNGTIRITATCPAGCTVTAHAGKGRAVTKHLGASSSRAIIKLPLTGAIQHRVKQARRKHKTITVHVTATATPKSGATKSASRNVKVS